MTSKTREQTLEHPTTLLVYLFVRSKYPLEVGSREIQRELNFKSPSISSWHLDKLEQAGILKKTPSNKYILTEEEANETSLTFPVKIPVHLFKGKFIPPFFLLGFLLTMTVSSFIFLFLNNWIALFNSFLGLVIATIIALTEFLKTTKRIKERLEN